MVGWTVCSLFASVAFNWTFYYVLALARRRPRDADQPPRGGEGSRSGRADRHGAGEPADPGPRMSLRRRRRILVDARTPVHYAMFAPVHRAMEDDDRVRFSFIASDEPAQAASIFRDAGAEGAVIGPMAAALIEVRRLPDVGLHLDPAAPRDLPHPDVPRRGRQIRLRRADRAARRVAPAVLRQPPAAEQLRRVGRARRGQPGDPDDRHAEGRLPGRPIVEPRRGPERARPSGASADRPLRANLVAGVVAEPARRRAAEAPPPAAGERHRQAARSIVRSAAAVLRRDRLAGDAGAPPVAEGSAVLASEADICPYLAAADVMVTDHSSAGFEYLLLDRPLVRIHVAGAHHARQHSPGLRADAGGGVRLDERGGRYRRRDRARARGSVGAFSHAPRGGGRPVLRTWDGHPTLRGCALRSDRAQRREPNPEPRTQNPERTLHPEP